MIKKFFDDGGGSWITELIVSCAIMTLVFIGVIIYSGWGNTPAETLAIYVGIMAVSSILAGIFTFFVICGIMRLEEKLLRKTSAPVVHAVFSPITADPEVEARDETTTLPSFME